jgi:hypothetical protein
MGPMAFNHEYPMTKRQRSLVGKNVFERTLKREIRSRFAHSLFDVFGCSWTHGQGVLVEALCRALVKEKMDDLIHNDSASEFFILCSASIT